MNGARRVPSSGSATPEAADWLATNATLAEGGPTLAEAEAANAEIGTLMQAEAERLRTEAAREDAQRTAGQMVLDDVTRQLVATGRLRRDVAEHQASLVAARYSVLADILTEETGDIVDPWTLYQERTGGGLEVVNDIPEALRDRTPTDQIDSILDDLRAGTAERVDMGPSLLAAIRRAGGVVDDTGDLTALDPPRGVLRPSRRNAAQGEIAPGMGNPDAAYDPEVIFEQLVDHGYFPEYRGHDVRQLPARDILAEAIREELAGSPRFSDQRMETEAGARAEALTRWRDYLDTMGLDVASMTNAEIKAVLAERESPDGVGYEQPAPRGAAWSDMAADQAEWSRSLDDVLSRGPRRNATVRVGAVPLVFNKLGLSRRDLVMQEPKLAAILRKHALTADDLRHLPALLADPIAVQRSGTERDAYVAILDLRDGNGDMVVAAIHTQSGDVTFHKLASVYGK